MKKRERGYLVSKTALSYEENGNVVMPSRENIEENIRSMFEKDKYIVAVYNKNDAMIIAKNRAGKLLQSNEEDFLIFEITFIPSKQKKDFYVPYNEYYTEEGTVEIDFLPGIMLDLEDDPIFTKAYVSYLTSEFVDTISLNNISAINFFRKKSEIQSENDRSIKKFLFASPRIAWLSSFLSMLIGLSSLVCTLMVFNLNPAATVALVLSLSLTAGMGTIIFTSAMRERFKRSEVNKLFENYDLTLEQESDTYDNSLFEISPRPILTDYNVKIKKGDETIMLRPDEQSRDKNIKPRR